MLDRSVCLANRQRFCCIGGRYGVSLAPRGSCKRRAFPSLFAACRSRGGIRLLLVQRVDLREQFGREFAERFLKACRKLSRRPEDALATATAFTAESIARNYTRFVHGKLQGRPIDYIVSGGGARNATLMAMLSSRLEPLGCELATTEGFGMPAEAKEAAAFALLAWMTWHRLPGNVPAATGAKRAVVLGQVTYV